MNALNKKRKITQNDLRLMMLQKKRKLTETKKKIDSPLAKYLDDGTLLCIICNSVVRTEAIWNIHINSKQHRENVIQRKQPKEKNIPMEIPKKESNKVSVETPVKLKSILKNKIEYPEPESADANFDKSDQNILDTTNEMEVDVEVTNSSRVNELPEGFFDDPIMDAKARNVSYKNPFDEEWERFRKEIQEENILSAQILDQDQETNAADKEIERIDEHMQLWSRMQILEEKIEYAQKRTMEKKFTVHSPLQYNKNDDADSSYGSDDEFDEYIDWRSKKAFK